MARCHGLAGHHTAALRLPEFERLEQAVHHPLGTPQYQGVAAQLVVVGTALAVVLQVNAGAGTVVFAGRVQGFGGAKAPLVLGQCLGFDVPEPGAAPAAQLGMQVSARGLGVERPIMISGSGVGCSM